MSERTIHEGYCGYPDDCNCCKVAAPARERYVKRRLEVIPVGSGVTQPTATRASAVAGNGLHAVEESDA